MDKFPCVACWGSSWILLATFEILQDAKLWICLFILCQTYNGGIKFFYPCKRSLLWNSCEKSSAWLLLLRAISLLGCDHNISGARDWWRDWIARTCQRWAVGCGTKRGQRLFFPLYLLSNFFSDVVFCIPFRTITGLTSWSLCYRMPFHLPEKKKNQKWRRGNWPKLPTPEAVPTT